MRLGHLSPEAIETFNSLSRTPEGDDGIEPTELYPLRHQVDKSNQIRLDALQGEMVEFHAKDKGDKQKIASCLAPELIQLKMHAQVMLLRNMDAELVNGSLGVVVGFAGKGKYKDPATLNTMRAPNRSVRDLMEDPLDMTKSYPIVQFANGSTMVVENDSWSVELPGGRSVASRSQLPLMLAWAISIHKSQGQTLDRVKVDLGKVFEKGQAYVALSRATSLNQLQVLNFEPARVMAHPRVSEFYRSLRTV
jgi:ATP-dependent DNA helicase PIF1